MAKTLLVIILGFTVFNCSAQKQLITFQDVQYLMQNPANVTNFLQQKDYRLQNMMNNEMQYFGLYGDNDYSNISVTSKGKHTIIVISTTHLPQVETLENALASYSLKLNKNTKTYRVKDDYLTEALVKTPDNQSDKVKIYTLEFKN